uniref:PARP-type domain-containing protein n=1 Tax=Salmo trutta TaxID=8032 RepID=A0A673YK68_SALTR
TYNCCERLYFKEEELRRDCCGGRASCKETIAKDWLRMAIMVQSPMFDSKVPHWHHFSCFCLRAAAQSHADITGFSDLRC